MDYIPLINKRIENIPIAESILKLSQKPSVDLFTLLGKNSIPFIYSEKFPDDLLSTISAIMGDQTVKVRTGEYALPEIYASTNRQIELQSLSLYLSKLKDKKYNAETIGYLGNHKITNEQLILLNIDFPGFLNKDSYDLPSLWIGPKGAVTPLHQDGLDNIAYHFEGKKKWTLIHPCYWEMLNVSQPFPIDAPNLYVSSLDFRKSDVYNKVLKNIPMINIEVSKNEVIFIPAGWFHFVENLEPTAMINFWTKSMKVRPLILS